jgi:hypothetical protein
LELFCRIKYGDEDTPSGSRRNGCFPARMFVDGKPSKLLLIHRFGQMCFTTNQNKAMWRASNSDHINGDKFDNRKTNTRWLDGTENNLNYHEGRRMSDDGGGKRGGKNAKGVLAAVEIRNFIVTFLTPTIREVCSWMGLYRAPCLGMLPSLQKPYIGDHSQLYRILFSVPTNKPQDCCICIHG